MACNLTITVPDGDGVLKNTDGTELSTTPIPSGASADIVAPDATAVVKDSGGNILATENIPSGVSEDIIVAGGGGAEVLYTYPYHLFYNNQTVSYATRDAKDVYDSKYLAEINTWDLTLVQSMPLIDPTDPTKLLRGSNPDGSGNNIFDNKERFTDINGLQVYGNEVIIDHAYGTMICKDPAIRDDKRTWSAAFIIANALTIGGFTDFHVGSYKEYDSITYVSQVQQFNYPPLLFSSVETNTATDSNALWCSTTNDNTDTDAFALLPNYRGSYLIIDRPKTETKKIGFLFRKAFTYNVTTKEMELS